MEELARRCEEASGPDRELDRDIARAVGAKASNGHVNIASRYTASIDAALPLVPEGGFWALGWNGPDSGHPKATASVFTVGGAMEKGSGETPALALCAAALRAKQAP